MIICRILNFIGYRCIDLVVYLDNVHHYPKEIYKQFLLEDPHDLKRISYPLNKNSLVVDVGGYTGDWASRIYNRYSCNIDIYEPHLLLSDKAEENFLGNKKIRVFAYGLGNKDDTLNLYGDFMNASLFKNSMGGARNVAIRKTSEVFNHRYSDKIIDLLKINVEGSEYLILPDLIAGFDMTRIKNIQILFHQNVPDCEEKRNSIRKNLSKTHKMIWNYDYVLESWGIRAYDTPTLDKSSHNKTILFPEDCECKSELYDILTPLEAEP